MSAMGKQNHDASMIYEYMHIYSHLSNKRNTSATIDLPAYCRYCVQVPGMCSYWILDDYKYALCICPRSSIFGHASEHTPSTEYCTVGTCKTAQHVCQHTAQRTSTRPHTVDDSSCEGLRHTVPGTLYQVLVLVSQRSWYFLLSYNVMLEYVETFLL